ncbi:hypothetical protein [Nocardia sp. NPDC051832]|uniref:hypothetical protein n=1 Tax=Nocardia sp. NPDC051832 TaxID=3155673 RepID=UPI00341CF960
MAIGGSRRRPRHRSLDLDADDPYLDVTGALVESKGKGTGGWIRKPAPKSENRWRRILLHAHTVEALREAIEHLEASGQPNPLGALFPSRTGTFRKGVATEVDQAFNDPERAARQPGNTTAVAKRHYIDIPETVPDNRAVLERWATGLVG